MFRFESLSLRKRGKRLKFNRLFYYTILEPNLFERKYRMTNKASARLVCWGRSGKKKRMRPDKSCF